MDLQKIPAEKAGVGTEEQNKWLGLKKTKSKNYEPVNFDSLLSNKISIASPIIFQISTNFLILFRLYSEPFFNLSSQIHTVEGAFKQADKPLFSNN